MLYAQEKEMQKILWDFEIQTNQTIPARKPDLVVGYMKEKKIVISRILPFRPTTDYK